MMIAVIVAISSIRARDQCQIVILSGLLCWDLIYMVIRTVSLYQVCKPRLLNAIPCTPNRNRRPYLNLNPMPLTQEPKPRTQSTIKTCNSKIYPKKRPKHWMFQSIHFLGLAIHIQIRPEKPKQHARIKYCRRPRTRSPLVGLPCP